MSTKIVQNELDPIPVEIIAESIVRLHKAANELLASGLTQRCLVTLLHDWCNGTVTRKQIITVLEALSSLRCNIAPKGVKK